MIKIRIDLKTYANENEFIKKYLPYICCVEPECLTEDKPFKVDDRVFYVVSFSPIKDLECLWDYECQIISQEERRQKILDDLCYHF